MNIGPGEWLIIAIIVILIFGIDRLPKIARNVGQSVRAFKDEVGENDVESVAIPIDEISTIETLLKQTKLWQDDNRLALSLQALFAIYGVNANRLANETGINRATIGRWLRGETKPQRESLETVLGAISGLSIVYRNEILRIAGFVPVAPAEIPTNPLQIYLSCHGPDLEEERQKLLETLRHTAFDLWKVEEGDENASLSMLEASLAHSDYLLLVQGLRWMPVREKEFQVATTYIKQLRTFYFQRQDKALSSESKGFFEKVGGETEWIYYGGAVSLTGIVTKILFDAIIQEARAGRKSIPLLNLGGLFLFVQSTEHHIFDLPALLQKLHSDEKTPTDENTPNLRRQAKFEPELIKVPAGYFWMGSDRRMLRRAGIEWKSWMEDETPLDKLWLPTYYIGRYPVTNTEFGEFIAAKGYSTAKFWTKAGWEWRSGMERQQPEYWTDETLNSPDLPAVGITWYEAVAYCRWLSYKTGRTYRLPTEAEWEKAARGSDGRIWPWGNTWRPNYTNSAEKGPGTPTPVGTYSPYGDSPYGAADMSGNVWEWVSTKDGEEYPFKVKDEWDAAYLEGDRPRVLRGGSFYGNENGARCAFRLRNHPVNWFRRCGFRVMLSPF